jgi:hypothetical protein
MSPISATVRSITRHTEPWRKEEVVIVRMLPIPIAADCLGVAQKTLRDARWRARVKLPLTRVGGRVGVLEDDILALLRRGREHPPGENRGCSVGTRRKENSDLEEETPCITMNKSK